MMAGLIVKEAMILEVERMIGMDEYEYIRLAHRVHGRSIRQIQRETGHDRKTIRKALAGEALKYAPRSQQSYPVLGAYREVIDQWLREDKEGPKKQRHTARRIYHRLVGEYGFQGSESTIRHYVREARVRLGVGNAQVFIPLDPECGRGEMINDNYFSPLTTIKNSHFRRVDACLSFSPLTSCFSN